jgi:hypothetical protein
VVVFVAERFERFDANGTPQRSWLSLRLRRVEEPEPRPAPPLPVTPQFELPSLDTRPDKERFAAVDVPVDDQGTPLDRLDQICAERYGSPALAPLLGAFNDLDNLLQLPEGATLSLPPLTFLLGTS